MNIRAVKSIINKTECKEFVYSGGYCSEPIMTKDQKGRIIDNYFIFSRSEDFSTIETPDVGFGIYTDNNEVAYINKEISQEFECSSYPETFDDINLMRNASKVYEELYEQIRDMFSLEKSRDDSIINMFIENLRILSGHGLFEFYKKLYPSFFSWVNNTKH